MNSAFTQWALCYDTAKPCICCDNQLQRL